MIKILVIKTSSMGDVIHTLPAITDTKNSYPDIQFDWVVEEAFVEIPRMHQAINRVIPIAFRRWRKDIFQRKNYREIKTFLHDLRKEHYDFVIDAQGLIKSAVLSFLAMGRRFGLDKSSARESIASLFYNKKFSVAKNQHAIMRVRQLFAASLNYPVPNTDPEYGINKNAFISDKILDNYLVFIHATSRNEKCWSEQKWIELAKIAGNKGYAVYLPWGNEIELARAERITLTNSKAKVFPKSNLTAIATLLANAKGVVAVDTGLGHLAAALSVPTVSLYGPTNVNLIGTCGKNQQHLLNFNDVSASEVWCELEETMINC